MSKGYDTQEGLMSEGTRGLRAAAKLVFFFVLFCFETEQVLIIVFLFTSFFV